MSYHQDLLATTRDMHGASLETEYMKKTPVLNQILEKKNLKFNGGANYYQELDTADKESLTQDYTVNEPLTHGDTDTLKRGSFTKKKFQHAITIDVDEDMQNANNNSDGTKLHDLAKHKVKKAQEAVRLHLRKLLYAGCSHTPVANAWLGTDTNKYIQGLNSALQIDPVNIPTYGGLARYETDTLAIAAGMEWWQPGDNRYTGTTQDANVTLSVSALQGWADPLTDLEVAPMDQIVVVGNTLFLALKSEAQALSMPVKYDPAGNFKYGIEEMIIDGMRIVKDSFLQTKYNSMMGMTTGQAGSLDRRLYILNMNDIQLMVHPEKYFAMTEFFDQSKIAGAMDFTLARIKFAGNMVLWHPNQHLYLPNVTA